MKTLALMLNRTDITLGEVTGFLDDLPHARRVEESRSLNPAQQSRLWDISEGKGEPLEYEYFVPADAKPFETFPFLGKNTLPAFTLFAKTFYREADGTIGGMNQQSLGPITGPGYYVLEKFDDGPSEMGVNYFKVPKTKPADWPTIQENTAGLNLSRVIYANMIDYLRWVSKDMVIGRAYAKGTKPMKAWFTLCRDKELPA